ncbi:MAG: hypothetical protein PWQ82_1242 [Thermosediminibacterales bacterium]|nr:hypothetical protein [Thermosediminibacterales bacterium]MDK2836766.1 hypothetical protein [Thermosediminibacterales bacterium]
MMNVVEEYNKLTQKEREEFTRILNKLLSITFLTRKKEDNRRDYYFIERNEALFREYLKLAGWEISSDKSLGVYRVENRFGYNRLQLKMDESIILLILRLCYEEKRKEINLTQNISVRIRELQEKYAALKIKDRPIDKKTLRETISMLKRFNIVDNLDSDVTDPETRLIIYPTIVFAVKVEDIRNIYDLLDNYKKTGHEVEEEEVDDDERTDED